MQDVIGKNSLRLALSMRLLDLGLLSFTGHALGLLQFGSALHDAAPIHAVLLYLCSGLAFLLFPQCGIYTSWRGRTLPAMALRLAAAWGVVLLIGIVFSFLIHQVSALSRLWMVYWFLCGFLLLTLSRLALYAVLMQLRKNGVNLKRVLLVGYGAIGREMHRRAKEQDWAGYIIEAIYFGSQKARVPAGSAITTINAISDVPAYAERRHIDEIWIALPLSAADELQQLQTLLRNTLIDIRWIPDLHDMRLLATHWIDFMGLPALDLNQPVASGLAAVAKDLFDKLFALAAILVLSPCWLAIAMAIKYDSAGPILFRQPRLGLNGRPFSLLKFRSMHVHENSKNIDQAKRDDPRVTRVGRFLRRTSLDELPQFLNVLMGDMSVVGPRPHALQHNAYYQKILEQYMLRHRVKPGITGWAQMHGYRGETDTVDKMAARVQFDLDYIRHWSLWMDIRIIFWTAFKGWSGKNAY